MYSRKAVISTGTESSELDTEPTQYNISGILKAKSSSDLRGVGRELRNLLNSFQDRKLTSRERLVLELVKKKSPQNFESFDSK